LTRRYYGWYLVSALGVTTIVSYGISQYLFGVLVVPIEHDLGWSRGAISAAYSGGLIVAAALGLPVGVLVDRHGGRWPMSAGSLLGGVTLLLLSRVTQLWQFYLLWAGCLGVAMALTFYSVSFVVVANWFERRRGRALALLTVVGGLSSPIYIPVAGLLVARLGWRTGLVVLGATALVIALPIHAVVVRRRPEDLGLLPDGERSNGKEAASVHGHRLRHAVRRHPFWTLMLATALSSAAYGVVIAHVVAYLIGIGYNPVLAAAILGLTGLVSLPGRFVFNFVSDRVGPQPLLALCLGLQAVSIVVLLAAASGVSVAAFVLIYGSAFGAISPLRASVLADHFGRLAYGAITAVQGLPSGVLAAVAPFIAGLLFDRFGDYVLTWFLTAGAFALGAIAVWLTPRAERRHNLMQSTEVS
jgi:MFS family permease